MYRPELIEIDQLGATGLVAETFQAIVADPRCGLKLALVGASIPEHRDQLLGDVALNCPEPLRSVRVVDSEQILESSESPLVFSGLRDEEARELEPLFARDRAVFTNSAANRMNHDVALVNAYVGGHQLAEVFSDQSGSGKIIGGGNCMQSIIVTALAPIYYGIGIGSLYIETLQGHSGAGARSVPKGQEGQITPIGEAEDSKLRTEANKFFGSMSKPADVAITAKANRAPWVDGHHARVELKLKRPTSLEELNELMRAFRAPDELKGVKYGKYSPKRRPIKVVGNNLVEFNENGVPRLTRSVKSMRATAHIKEFNAEDPTKVTLEVIGDNLGLGAAGTNVMSIMYARARGYI